MADKLRIVAARISPKLAARVDKVTAPGLRPRFTISELVAWGLESVLPEAEEALRLGKARRPDNEILAEARHNEQVIAKRAAHRKRKADR